MLKKILCSKKFTRGGGKGHKESKETQRDRGIYEGKKNRVRSEGRQDGIS